MLAPSTPDVATILDGTLNGRAIHVEARLFDPAKFPPLRRGFNWIQERPFNR